MARRRNDSDPFNERDVESLLNAFTRLDRRAQVWVVIVVLVIGGIAAVLYYRSHSGSRREIRQL